MNVSFFSKEVFSLLISALHQNDVPYCVIGDYHKLPDEVGHDIDIWTADCNAFRRTLFNVLANLNFHVIIDNKTANGCNIVFFRQCEERLTIMKIDVLTDTSYKSTFTLVNRDLISSNRIQYKDFYVANHQSEAIMHFVYPLFEWGVIKKEAYKKEIADNYQSEIFQQSLINLWGKNTANELSNLIKNENWEQIISIMPKLKRKAMMRLMLRHSTWQAIINTLCYTLYRKIKPSGKCIAFCGLDGAGKTTILDEMNDIFTRLLKSKKVFYGYWRPYVLPEIRELFGKKNSKHGVDLKSQKGVTCIEKEKSPRNSFVSFVKLCYFVADYNLERLKYGSVKERGGVVLFDRHYIDMIIHPQRFEMKLPRKILFGMYKLIPKPDYTFFLYCTPDEILQRKKEFSKSEIISMTNEYNSVGEKIKHFIAIHTNTTVEREIGEILNQIR